MEEDKNKQRLAEVERLRDKLEPMLSACHADCSVRFDPDRICLLNSCRIHSPRKRLEICRLIADSGLTKRTPESLSAEWFFHNAAYRLHIQRTSSKDADLDFTADTRKSVRLLSKLCEKLHLY